ncbi:hypothetical protein C8R45DRAFT_1003795 [Mycena sanguinolenta]|nr:hypothetical protein C8R45DRAFT_1003795 [Mycena sanguinolenta]
MSAQEAPVLLGLICSSWRAISLSMPRLWSRLHVVKPPFPYNMNSTALRRYQAKVAQRLEVSGAWLRRSGRCPLSISLQCSHNYDPSNDLPPPFAPSSNAPSSKDAFLNVLIPFASRWQDISVTIPSSAVQALLDLTGHDVPRLQSLAIVESDARPNLDLTWSSPGSILCAPGLSRFSLTGGYLHETRSSRLPLPWSNLTVLTLLTREQTCQDILDVLARCSQLRTCKLGLEHQSEHRQDSIVECVFLHSIEIWCSSSPLHNSGRLLSRLSLPALQDFTLDGLDEPSNSDFLLSALATYTRLQYISISSAMFWSHELVDFLRGLTPSVRRLRVAERWQSGPFSPILDDNFFEALEPSTVLPALEEVVITTGGELSDEALLRFIVSRMPTLRRVDIKFDREMQVNILPTLQSFVESGPQVSLAYTTSPLYIVSPYLGLPDAPQLGSW